MSVQIRPVVGYSRGDARVRELQRASVSGDTGARAELERISNRGDWRLVAIETYSRWPRPPAGEDECYLPVGSEWRAAFVPWGWVEGGREEAIRKRSGDWVAWRGEGELPHWWEDRDYTSFGVLANVRRHPPNGPISEPRGLPDGLILPRFKRHGDPDEDEEPGETWLGDHSHSWATAREIVEYDWDSVRDHDPRKSEFGPLVMARSWGERYGVDNVRLVFGFDS